MHLEGDFGWGESAAASLSGVRLSVPQGSMVAVVGATGSGKTSLLSAALGLMTQASGPPVRLRGKVLFQPNCFRPKICKTFCWPAKIVVTRQCRGSATFWLIERYKSLSCLQACIKCFPSQSFQASQLCQWSMND